MSGPVGQVVEILLFAALLVLGLVPLLATLFGRRRAARQRDGHRRLVASLAVVVGASGIAAAALGRPRVDAELDLAVPERTPREEFVSSSACQSCHPSQHASWHASFHRTMTQVASPASILASFDGVHLEGRGREVQLERRGDQFWARVRSAGRGRLPQGWSRIVMTTGSHHFQVYWIATPDGSFVQFPWLYRIAEKQWLPTVDSFLRPHSKVDDDQQWVQCSQCHTTDYQPRYDKATRQFDFRVTELGIACEACHGPGAAHVAANQNPLRRYRYRLGSEPDPTIVNPARVPHDVSAQICGQCHATVVPKDQENALTAGATFHAGDALADHFRTLVHLSGKWTDGTVRTGGREFSGMSESGCYERGEISCLSCHSMHESSPDDQLAPALAGDQACLQCHATFAEEIEAHTHHAPASAGSRCYGCHMPHTSYALFGAIRSHRIDSPSVATNSKVDRPNACNLCHLDRPLGWTAEHLTAWYGAPPAELTRDEREVAAGVVWGLSGDAAQRVITAWALGQPDAQRAAGTEWMPLVLGRLLGDPYSAVRAVAYDALRTLPGYGDLDYDFLAPAGARERASERVLRAVLEQGSQLAAAETPALPPADVLSRLAAGRDDRQVMISE